MNDVTERFFLVVFDDAEQALVHDVVVFDDAPDALRAYGLTEELHRADPRVEVVLLLADSIATLEVTHRIYFAGAGDDDLRGPSARQARPRAGAAAGTP